MLVYLWSAARADAMIAFYVNLHCVCAGLPTLAVLSVSSKHIAAQHMLLEDKELPHCDCLSQYASFI